MKISLEALVVAGWTAFGGGATALGVVRTKEYLGEGNPALALYVGAFTAAAGLITAWPYIRLWLDRRREYRSRTA